MDIRNAQMLRLERLLGKSIQDIVIEAYEQTGSNYAAAARLGVHRVTYLRWRKQLGIGHSLTLSSNV